MITVYLYKEDFTFSHAELVNENSMIPSNATTTAPSGYNPFYYNKDSDTWIGVSKEEWEQTHPNVEAPTDTDQLKTMVGTLVAENAKKDQSIKQLQTMAGTLVAQVAELQKGSN